MIEASPLPSVRRAIASLVTSGLSPLSERIAAYIRSGGWTNRSVERIGRIAVGRAHLRVFAGLVEPSDWRGGEGLSVELTLAAELAQPRKRSLAVAYRSDWSVRSRH